MNVNLDKLNCENVGSYIRNDLIKIIYKTHLSEECNSVDETLSLPDFLQLFR